MRQKMELIQEIRAMQATSAARQPKPVDLTETAGYGLLCEMSIAEVCYVTPTISLMIDWHAWLC